MVCAAKPSQNTILKQTVMAANVKNIRAVSVRRILVRLLGFSFFLKQGVRDMLIKESIKEVNM